MMYFIFNNVRRATCPHERRYSWWTQEGDRRPGAGVTGGRKPPIPGLSTKAALVLNCQVVPPAPTVQSWASAVGQTGL